MTTMLIISLVFSAVYVICEFLYTEYKEIRMKREREYLQELQIILDDFGYKINTLKFTTVDDVMEAIDSIPDKVTKREIKRDIFYSPLNPRLRKIRDEMNL